MPTSVRQLGINPNYWYVVARSDELQSHPLGVRLWQEAIVLYRDRSGVVRAFEDRCPHRQVQLSHGKVWGDRLECSYHGWQFQEGRCVAVPYLGSEQKLPSCKLRSYPVLEQDGFIWVFLGDNPGTKTPLPIPQWHHLNYIATVAVLECQAHYSYLIENLMDMYHGHLHQDWQAWTDARLDSLEVGEERIDAHYQAQSYYRIDKIWSISQLFFPALRRLHPEPLDVSYVYPHWQSALGKDFQIYCLLCPLGLTETKAYLIHFTSLEAFWRLHKLPVWFRRWLKTSLFDSAQKMLDGLVRQDVAAIEQEQQAYLQNPRQRNLELNPAIAPVQKLMLERAYQQQT